MSALRVAAVDCGTNSLRLLVTDIDGAAGTAGDVVRRAEIVRIGEGVDATGRISVAAMDRALAVTAEYAGVCRATGVAALRFVATSATRDADNAADFAVGVQALLGVVPEVLSGEDEARLSFAGAVRGLPGTGAGPVVVVDLGGGSTEVVLGDPASGEILAAVSVDVGSVRLTERHLASDPPTPTEVAAAAAVVERALEDVAARVDLSRARQLIGVAGTVTTVTAHALALASHPSGRVQGVRLPVDAVRRACASLLTATRAERATLPYLHPGRVDVIGAGALVWDLVVARVAGAAGLDEVTTSEHDILDGVAWQLAGSAQRR